MHSDKILLIILEFSNVFNEFNHLVSRYIDAQLNKTGLGRTHFGILHELVGEKEKTMSELSDILHVTKPNITVLVDKLVKLNYVERVNSSHDRRVILIRLTKKGDDFVNVVSEELKKSSIRLLNRFNEEDLELVRETSGAIKKLLSKFNQD